MTDTAFQQISMKFLFTAFKLNSGLEGATKINPTSAKNKVFFGSKKICCGL
jgi:hypothetical protein